MNIPDYNDLYRQHEAREQALLDKLPKCDWCGEPITDDYCYEINGDIICEACLNDNFKKRVDDYIE